MQQKIAKRILIIEDYNTYLYLVQDLKKSFDDVILLTDYMKPVTELTPEEINFPAYVYNKDVNPLSKKPLKIRTYDKVDYAKLRDLDLGDNNAYFVVGKKSWYFIRDMQEGHVGLRNTNLDWQIVHLTPFSMGTNKFVFCHTMVDEHYKKHMSYFFNDEYLLSTVPPLQKSKVLSKIDEIEKALQWGIDQEEGTRFGLDYETNGLIK